MSLFHELCILGAKAESFKVAQKIDEAISLTNEFQTVGELNEQLASGLITFAEWRNAIVAVLV